MQTGGAAARRAGGGTEAEAEAGRTEQNRIERVSQAAAIERCKRCRTGGAARRAKGDCGRARLSAATHLRAVIGAANDSYGSGSSRENENEYENEYENEFARQQRDRSACGPLAAGKLAATGDALAAEGRHWLWRGGRSSFGGAC